MSGGYDPGVHDKELATLSWLDFTEDELEAARVLFSRRAEFVMGAAKIEQLPEPDRPVNQNALARWPFCCSRRGRVTRPR